MVAALTVGKPKYASVEAEMAEVLSKTEALKERLLSLMDEDAGRLSRWRWLTACQRRRKSRKTKKRA
jgi:hypothetical protein